MLSSNSFCQHPRWGSDPNCLCMGPQAQIGVLVNKGTCFPNGSCAGLGAMGGAPFSLPTSLRVSRGPSPAPSAWVRLALGHVSLRAPSLCMCRKDLCAAMNQPCETLGLSHVAGMCQPHRSCNINEDTGLPLAFTVAHELGHRYPTNPTATLRTRPHLPTCGHQTAKSMAHTIPGKGALP